MRHSTTAVLAAVFALAAVPASAQPESPLAVSYPSDGGLDCGGLTAEIARMDGIIGGSNGDIAGAQGSARAAELGASAGINAALYSGALGRVPGLGAFGNSAANMMKQRAAAKQKEAEGRIRVAETRRAMLMGMQAGKSCAGSGAAVPAPQVPAPVATGSGSPGLPSLPAEATRHY